MSLRRPMRNASLFAAAAAPVVVRSGAAAVRASARVSAAAKFSRARCSVWLAGLPIGEREDSVIGAMRRPMMAADTIGYAGTQTPTMRIPAAAHFVPARRHRHQPQEDAAAVPRGGPDGASSEGTTTHRRRAGTGSRAGAAQPALEPRLRPRSAGWRPALPGAERRR